MHGGGFVLDNSLQSEFFFPEDNVVEDDDCGDDVHLDQGLNTMWLKTFEWKFCFRLLYFIAMHIFNMSLAL